MYRYFERLYISEQPISTCTIFYYTHVHSLTSCCNSKRRTLKIDGQWFSKRNNIKKAFTVAEMRMRREISGLDLSPNMTHQSGEKCPWPPIPQQL